MSVPPVQVQKKVNTQFTVYINIATEILSTAIKKILRTMAVTPVQIQNI